MPVVALPSHHSLERSQPCPEAGFSLVEVLAALTITALTLGMVVNVFSGVARLGHRLEMQTTARMLARAVLADGTAHSDALGQFHWQIQRDKSGARQLWINWPNSTGFSLTRMDSTLTLKDVAP